MRMNKLLDMAAEFKPEIANRFRIVTDGVSYRLQYRWIWGVWRKIKDYHYLSDVRRAVDDHIWIEALDLARRKISHKWKLVKEETSDE